MKRKKYKPRKPAAKPVQRPEQEIAKALAAPPAPEVTSPPIPLVPQLLFSQQHLVSLFALPDKLHAFKAADIWWADNVMHQLEGIDVFRPGAHTVLREWYEQNARPHYEEKLEEKRRQEDQQAMEADKDDTPPVH